MPSTSLQDAIKEAYVSCPSDIFIYHTLEIRQTGVQDSKFLVKSRQTLLAYDETNTLRTYQPTGFQFSLPPENDEGFRSLNLAIDNVGREISDFINAAKSAEVPVEVIYRPYTSDDLTAPQMNPPLLLWLKNISVTDAQVTGRATFMDLVNKKFPLELYTRARFPNLSA